MADYERILLRDERARSGAKKLEAGVGLGVGLMIVGFFLEGRWIHYALLTNGGVVVTCTLLLAQRVLASRTAKRLFSALSRLDGASRSQAIARLPGADRRARLASRFGIRVPDVDGTLPRKYGYGWLVRLWVTGIVAVMVWVGWSLARVTLDVGDFADTLPMLLMTVPAVFLAAYLWAKDSESLVVDEAGVRLKRWLRPGKSVNWGDVRAVSMSSDRLGLEGAGSSIAVNYRLKGFGKFSQAVLARVPERARIETS